MADSHVIVGTDGSDVSLRAVEWAAREAALRDRPLRIVSVPALPPRMSWYQHSGPPAVADVVHERAEQAVAGAAARATAVEPGVGVSTAVLLKTVKTEPPAQRQKGVMVKDVAELVDVLKKKGLI